MFDAKATTENVKMTEKEWHKLFKVRIQKLHTNGSHDTLIKSQVP